MEDLYDQQYQVYHICIKDSVVKLSFVFLNWQPVSYIKCEDLYYFISAILKISSVSGSISMLYAWSYLYIFIEILWEYI